MCYAVCLVCRGQSLFEATHTSTPRTCTRTGAFSGRSAAASLPSVGEVNGGAAEVLALQSGLQSGLSRRDLGQLRVAKGVPLSILF